MSRRRLSLSPPSPPVWAAPPTRLRSLLQKKKTFPFLFDRSVCEFQNDESVLKSSPGLKTFVTPDSSHKTQGFSSQLICRN